MLVLVVDACARAQCSDDGLFTLMHLIHCGAACNLHKVNLTAWLWYS
jgi:hypothetical protein